jgi:hypothetical protein
MTTGGVERIVSPVKVQQKKVSFSLESGYEGSSQSTPATASTPQEFLSSFVQLLPHFKKNPIQIKVVNKALRKMSTSEGMPRPAYFEDISDKKVGQSFSCLSSAHISSVQKRD